NQHRPPEASYMTSSQYQYLQYHLDLPLLSLLQRDGDNQALHSFPTRRSSDLNCAASSGCCRCSGKLSNSNISSRNSSSTNSSSRDRKSTRLNSSHVSISYAVFCLKKKKVYIILGVL